MKQNAYMIHMWSARKPEDARIIEALITITPGYTHHLVSENSRH